jgi:hypothetical protein
VDPAPVAAAAGDHPDREVQPLGDHRAPPWRPCRTMRPLSGLNGSPLDVSSTCGRPSANARSVIGPKPSATVRWNVLMSAT